MGNLFDKVGDDALIEECLKRGIKVEVPKNKEPESYTLYGDIAMVVKMDKKEYDFWINRINEGSDYCQVAKDLETLFKERGEFDGDHCLLSGYNKGIVSDFEF